MTSKQEILTEATRLGWTHESGINEVLLTRGREHLFVCFGVRGQVTIACTNTRRLFGRDRKNRVLTIIRERP